IPAALSCLLLLRGIKAIKVSVNVVACNSPTTATVLGTSAARWGGSSSVLVDGWDFTSLPIPGRARGLVAEWLVGMAALLRFVRGRPERDGAAVVVCSSSASIASRPASSPRHRPRPPSPPSTVVSTLIEVSQLISPSVSTS
ncbi:uncharacterized protein SCHCODRAFT_01334881, partial [Schizophyllum commune H4-8]|uniref:uncharacterized protein n=1 Tax=Schizophyllum commune (strain H4-8 / FGSC 9210) TaxID=578458 RepID=UPI002160B84C